MELLSSEERNALRAPFGEGVAPSPERALFPSVGQLDPDRTAALAAGVLRWLEFAVADLSRALRAPCDLRPPRQQSVPRSALPPSDETPFWARLVGHPGHYLLLSLPRPFAATICERIFGAPLTVREDRDLTAGELTLLGTLTTGWMTELARIWPGFQTAPCEAPDRESGGSDGGRGAGEVGRGGEPRGGSWLRLMSTVRVGAVEGSLRLTMAPATARLILGESNSLAANPTAPGAVMGRLGDVPLQVRAVLGETDVSLDQLARLSVGDVIALERRTRDPVEVFVADQLVFRGRAGLSGRQVAVELLPESEKSSGIHGQRDSQS